MGGELDLEDFDEEGSEDLDGTTELDNIDFVLVGFLGDRGTRV